MNIRNNAKALAIAVFASCISMSANAFNTNKYASTSRLSTGKWVKIKIDKTGMYELTNSELAEMGFNDPSKVRIYGSGGYVISEVLDGSAADDLTPVSIGLSNDKIYFYAKGTVNMKISDYSQPHYIRSINTYSTAGYYFITEESGNANYIATASDPTTLGSNARETSLDYAYHESELNTYSYSGKDLYGEPFTSPSSFNASLPGIAAQTPVVVNCAIAVKVSESTNLIAKLNNDSVPFATINSTIRPIAGYESYKTLSPYATVVPEEISSDSKLNISVSDPSFLTSGYLDYYILTYYHENSFYDMNQMRIGYADLDIYDKVRILTDSESLKVWNVTNPDAPKQFNLRTSTIKQYDEFIGDSISVISAEFSPGTKDAANFIAFDPSTRLYKIAGYEQVANQNIHGAATPDLVIICTDALRAQAERLANIHRKNDNMDVLVVDQKEVFNEFSSGTPDASAYRLMLKMFYDRDPEKLKYLLMFGGGYFDNRQITRKKGDNYLLTYQSTNSNNSIFTFVSDDYYGLLSDNSGNNITGEKLLLGIGRLPVISEEEASNVVDKIEAYINDKDYSNWRNKVLIMDETGDEDIHMFQGARIANLIKETSARDVDIKKIHIAAYTISESATNPVYVRGNNNTYAGRLQLSQYLQEGLSFATYMGHGGATSISKKGIWNINDVSSTPLARLPIMTMAACDIANYDSNTRGIGEYMIITPGHGAIGILTSTRSVEATENDILNRAFIRALFTPDDDGSFPTLGEATMKAKQTYGTQSSRNKMCYTLFADPALKPNFPKSQISVEVDGKANEEVVLKPMTRVNVYGEILNSDKTPNTAYHGSATVSLYDAEQYYTTINYNSEETKLYFDRPLLTETTVPVTNGKFSASIIVPKDCKADSTALIRVYAHNTDNTILVNGINDNLKFAEYDETDDATIVDTEAPSIDKMYINDETDFANDMNVAPDFTLHIVTSDNVALSNQNRNIGHQMTLILDGVTYISQIKGFANGDGDGSSLNISVPITGLSEGQHTLKFTVYDAAGNGSSQTISFIVVAAQVQASLSVDEHPAIDVATFNLKHKFVSEPSVKLFVTNAKNQIVWSKSVDTFPYEWDLTDNDGNRLPAGVYNYFGTAKTASQSAGTNIGQIVIINK